ncbi:Transcription factor Pur-alpha 1 [Camellia lanceoleosa]|uniref:Transcription factor Pur-alpha 1 n=1 Tax=Camellia lanceoleosa TaxID=1840588 RepID=A0ACC0FCL5_9ERIC|nr:Transcription factor Pur-alpha 1 [Camellia lanceoleosa]
MAYRGRASELRVEHKIIIIKIDKESRGELVQIIERNRAKSFSVKIDLGGVFWAMEALLEAWRKISETTFFSKYRRSSAVFCLQRFDNRRGVFVELSKWMAGTKMSNIIILVEVNGQGWIEMAGLLGKIIHGDNKEKSLLIRTIRMLINDREFKQKGGAMKVPWWRGSVI